MTHIGRIDSPSSTSNAPNLIRTARACPPEPATWEPESRPKAVDLFAGAGGFSLGALSAGINVVAAVEKDQHACTTYEWNLVHTGLTKTRLFQRDILDFDPKTMMAEIGLKRGECHVLLGGPPCQGFSSHRLNDAGVDDPRNRLLLRYFEFVRALRPRFFIVENVPGMLWPRHKSYVDEFKRLSAEAGYDLPEPFTLNARDYGVPQNRKRVFLFGVDRKRSRLRPWPPQPTHFAPAELESEKANGLSWKPASVVFQTKAPLADPNDIHMNHGPELVKAFLNTPINGGSRFDSGRRLKCHEDHDGHYDVYGRIDPNEPGPTMTTACINPSKGRFVHPTEPHGITLRQAARLQTFPDWFLFAGGLMAGGCQAGNAVPVEMARALLWPLAQAWRPSRKAGQSHLGSPSCHPKIDDILHLYCDT